MLPSAVAATQIGAAGRMSITSLSGAATRPLVPTGAGAASATAVPTPAGFADRDVSAGWKLKRPTSSIIVRPMTTRVLYRLGQWSTFAGPAYRTAGSGAGWTLRVTTGAGAASSSTGAAVWSYSRRRSFSGSPTSRAYAFKNDRT